MAIDPVQLANAKATLNSVLTPANFTTLQTALDQLKLAKVPSVYIVKLETFIGEAIAIKSIVNDQT